MWEIFLVTPNVKEAEGLFIHLKDVLKCFYAYFVIQKFIVKNNSFMISKKESVGSLLYVFLICHQVYIDYGTIYISKQIFECFTNF